MASRADLRAKQEKTGAVSPAAYFLGGGTSEFVHTAFSVPPGQAHARQSKSC